MQKKFRLQGSRLRVILYDQFKHISVIIVFLLLPSSTIYLLLISKHKNRQQRVTEEISLNESMQTVRLKYGFKYQKRENTIRSPESKKSYLFLNSSQNQLQMWTRHYLQVTFGLLYAHDYFIFLELKLVMKPLLDINSTKLNGNQVLLRLPSRLLI